MEEKTHIGMKGFTMDISSRETIITMTSSYNLTCDMVMRKIVPFQMDDYAGFGCYTLNVEDELQYSEIGLSGRHSKVCVNHY